MISYVRVICEYDPLGDITPLAVIWHDGSQYKIDRVLQKAPALTQDGLAGTRYTCLIHHQRRYLYLQHNRWFIEKT